MPLHLLAFIADQVRVSSDAITGFARRLQTRYEHLAALKSRFRFADLTDATKAELKRWLAPIARDALIADIAPEHLRGASFRLRQSLDTVGAFLGPLLAILLMWPSANNFTVVFWFAVIPAGLSMAFVIFVRGYLRYGYRRVLIFLARDGMAMSVGP